MIKIAIKIGSLVLTRSNGQLNSKAIKHIVCDVAKIIKNGNKKVVIVSSGAVSSGRVTEVLQGDFHVDVKNQDKHIVRAQILASIGQSKLIAFYAEEFKKHGLVCAQILVTRLDFAKRKRFLSLRTVIRNLLNLNIMPIINENDVLCDEELDFSDNDQLAYMVSKMLSIDKLIILTNVEGVYDRSPKKVGAKLLSKIDDIKEVFKNIDDEKNIFGRGGMKSKLQIAQLVTSFGIPMHIVSGFKENAASDIILNNKPIGTFFPAKKK